MIKVQDIIYVAHRVPDLDRMEAFLTDFGMVKSERRGDRLFMRGAGPRPFIHMTEKGEPGFVACGFAASSMADLEKIAGKNGASGIEDIDGPGGGKRVRLKGPDGFRVDVCYGMGTVPELPLREPLRLNYARTKNRQGDLQRPAKEPARINKIGHCGWKVSDADKAIFTEVLEQWAGRVGRQIATREAELLPFFKDKGLTIIDVDRGAFEKAVLAKVPFAEFGYDEADWQAIKALR